MTNYIYMTEDRVSDKYAESVIFKAGYTKHPKQRSGQLKQAARRTIGQEVSMKICNYYIAIHTDNKADTRFIEQYVLRRIMRRPTVHKLSKEFCTISPKQRQYCYEHLEIWVTEAMKIRGLK